MTTIACDGHTMAGDGLLTSGGVICATNAIKVFRLADGSLYGACGDSFEIERHRVWIVNGMSTHPPRLGCDFGFLLLDPDGRLFEGGDSAGPCLISAPFAVGSGFKEALGAMRAGASPALAIKIAAEIDPFTGGIVNSLSLPPKGE